MKSPDTSIHTKAPIDFETIYASYAGALYKIVTERVKDSDIAEAVFCRIFIFVHSHYHEYDSSKSRIFTWLIKIMNRELLNAGSLQ